MTAAAAVAVVLWAATAAATGPRDGGHFRDAMWGATPDEVLALEAGDPISRDDDFLVFYDRLYGEPVFVAYFFDDGHLVMGFFQHAARHEDLNDCFGDYEGVRDRLSADFGRPDVENWQYTNEEIETQRELWGDALGYGLLTVETGWIAGDTVVGLRLSGANFAAHLLTVFVRAGDLDRGRLAWHDYFAERVGVPNPYFRR